MIIRALETAAELRACVALQEATWGAGFSERVPHAVLWFARRIGGVLLGAFDGDEMIGFVFGITGYRDGRPLHWSDMLAVRADARDRGIGIRLKRAQRSVLLDAGVRDVQWTFDPLESRNAYLNFARLGVISREYIRDVYGDSDSPLHGLIGTDRLVAEWPLASERVEQRLASAGRGAPAAVGANAAASPTANAAGTSPAGESIKPADTLRTVNAVSVDGGVPRCGAIDTTLDADRVMLVIPASIQTIKSHAPEVAVAWRSCTRAAFEAYLARGYVATEVVRRDEWTSGYILEERFAVA